MVLYSKRSKTSCVVPLFSIYSEDIMREATENTAQESRQVAK